MAVLAVSGLAFSQASKTHGTVNQQWFLVNPSQPNLASSYSDTNPGFDCTGSNIICSIVAPDAGGQPDLSILGPVTENEAEYQATRRN